MTGRVKAVVDKWASNIDRELMRILDIEYPQELYDACRHLFTAGGKRIRPILFLLGVEIGGKEPDKYLRAATSVELIHTFSLIHDDIMDDDQTRRGAACVHQKWGVPVAILAGDTLLGTAYQVIQNGLADAAAQTRAMRILSQAVLELCEGQALDLEFEGRDDIREDQYIEMVKKKTGSLLASSLSAGVALAGAQEHIVNVLYEFGMALGVAFQLRDDILDLMAKGSSFGRKVGSDLIRRKMTLVMINAREKGVTLREVDRDTPQAELEVEIEKLKQAGCIDYAASYASVVIENARNLLIKELPQSDARDTLCAFAEFAITRGH